MDEKTSKVTLTGPAKINGKRREAGWNGEVSEEIRDQLVKAGCLPQPTEIEEDGDEMSIVDALHQIVADQKSHSAKIKVNDVNRMLGRKISRAQLDEALVEFETAVRPIVELMIGEDLKSYQTSSGDWDKDKLSEAIGQSITDEDLASAAIIASGKE